jgi:hypothetical protein
MPHMQVMPPPPTKKKKKKKEKKKKKGRKKELNRGVVEVVLCPFAAPLRGGPPPLQRWVLLEPLPAPNLCRGGKLPHRRTGVVLHLCRGLLTSVGVEN